MCFINREFLQPINVALIFLLPIAYTAIAFGHLHAIIISILAVLIFNFFFIVPLFTFHVMDKNYILSFVITIATGQIMAFLAHKAKDAKELQISARINEAIIGSISHELKTPLSVAMGALSCVDKLELSDIQKQDLIKTAFDALKKVNRLMENLLDMARVEDKRLALKLCEVEIGEIIYAVLNKYKSYDIVCDLDDITLMCDIGLTEIMITNLIENSIKYGSNISVHIDETDTLVLIDVRNNIKADIKINPQNLCDKFARGENSKGIYGLGLGLCICDNIIKAHKGHMELSIEDAIFSVKVYLPKAMNE